MVGNEDTVSAIKTDDSAITLQLHKIEEGAKGPGFLKDIELRKSVRRQLKCSRMVKHQEMMEYL